jgi:hypothetical protein
MVKLMEKNLHLDSINNQPFLIRFSFLGVVHWFKLVDRLPVVCSQLMFTFVIITMHRNPTNIFV